jgi:hypothetical protein
LLLPDDDVGDGNKPLPLMFIDGNDADNAAAAANAAECADVVRAATAALAAAAAITAAAGGSFENRDRRGADKATMLENKDVCSIVGNMETGDIARRGDIDGDTLAVVAMAVGGTVTAPVISGANDTGDEIDGDDVADDGEAPPSEDDDDVIEETDEEDEDDDLVCLRSSSTSVDLVTRVVDECGTGDSDTDAERVREWDRERERDERDFDR